MIRLWNSYACNNSTAYRLVARFPDAGAADEVRAELDEFFIAQARNRRRGALGTLAKNYGFDWIDSSSGDAGVVAQDEVVVVYHTMCLGLGPGPTAYIEDRGGVAERPTTADIQVTALFLIDPAIEPHRYDELIVLFASQVDAENHVLLLKPPWAKYRATGSAVWFRDGGMIGLHFPIKPLDIPAFQTWLAGFGIQDAVFRIEDRRDRDLFLALAGARCSSCNGKLAYLDPRLHDIETPQLLCHPCGGLYELATFFEDS